MRVEVTDKKGAMLFLAASGGGHVRQILDLEPFWKARGGYLFVTEPTALGQSIAASHPTEFVEHVALGQAKLGAPVRMMIAAVRNCWSSWRIVRRYRPGIVITTGAGSMFFTILWARLFGARIVVIDSFARFNAPSAFARLGGPLAHVRIAQSPDSARLWPGSLLFDPFLYLDQPRPTKEPLVFATVGATLKFDRLVELVAGAKQSGLLPERVVMQVGEGGVRPPSPPGTEFHEALPFDEVQAILKKADIVVCHGGTGSLITALRQGCRVIAIPRTFAQGEHYDDHQSEITKAFAERGLIEFAEGPDDFAEALKRVRASTPRMATTDPSALRAFLFDYAARMEYEAAAVRS
jgi:UDP-N-acetylglucosamine--N-acetylmuramyl-(pentapeptide) pyrophosphoryl-undecaprenol N-acetylglucosamine transferase